MTIEKYGAPVAGERTTHDVRGGSGFARGGSLLDLFGRNVSSAHPTGLGRSRIARLIAVPVLMIGAALGGCATSPPTSAARVVVERSTRLDIHGVTASKLGASILVGGRVKRRSVSPTPIWGHLHVEAWGGGQKLAERDTRWQMLGRHRLPGSTFRTELEVEPRLVEEIRISHVGKHERDQVAPAAAAR